MARLHQFLPALNPWDAVGNHVLAIQNSLQAASMAGRIWVEEAQGELEAVSASYQGYGAEESSQGAGRLLMYQSYVGSRGLVDFLLRRREPLSVYYHNITPPSLLRAFDAEAGALMEQGREELNRLAPRVRLALTGSGYNAAELRRAGVRDVRLLPPYMAAGSAPDPAYLRRLEEGKRGMDLLFVGRVVPHKGHRRLLELAALLRRGGDREVRIFFVGCRGPSSYMFSLERLRDRLGLQEVAIFTGSLPDSHLAAHYMTADAFVCLSEHEGFCIPVVEAMRAGVPVIAYGAGAVPETLGGAGVLLGRADPFVAAEIVSRVVSDGAFRGQLRERQLRRAAELDGFDRQAVLLDAVRDLARM
jgi:glycosyltransferase involved in cell wall biosynthesis